MFSSKTLLVTLGSVLVIVLIGGGYLLYQETHLSLALRRSLIEAVNPTTSSTEREMYLRKALRQIHTKRDWGEFAKLQTAARDARLAEQTQQRMSQRLTNNLSSLAEKGHSEQLLLLLEQAYQKSHRSLPAGLQNDITQAFRERQQAQQQERAAEAQDRKLYDQQHADALRLMHELRSDLGLPASYAAP